MSTVEFPAFRTNLYQSASLSEYVDVLAGPLKPSHHRKQARWQPPGAVRAGTDTIQLNTMHDFIDLLKVPEADRAVVVSVNVSNGFDLTPDVTGGLARALPFVSRLSFTRSVCSGPPIAQLVSRWPMLAEVSLMSCPNAFTDDEGAVMKALSCCPALLSFRAKRCAGLSDAHILQMYPLPTDPPPAARSVPPSLAELELSNCPGITDASLHAIASAAVEGSPGLESVTLSFCTNEGLTDVGITALAAAHPGLLKLDLTGCTQITGDFILALAKHSTALTELTLAGCISLKPSVFRELVLSPIGRTITQLDLTRCEQMTAEPLLFLVSRCASLNILNVTACPSLSEEDLAALATASTRSLTIIRHHSSATNPSGPALVPGFVPPPPKAQFKARTFFSTVKLPKDSKKKGAKKKK